jgi:hypothetical protein
LDGFLLALKINGSGVIFPSLQPISQLTESNYVFFGRSQTVITDDPFDMVDPLVGIGNGGDSYLGFDATDDGSNAGTFTAGNSLPITLNDNDNLLLVRVNLTGVMVRFLVRI